MSMITVDWLAREALMILQSNMVATLLTDRQYEADFTGNEARGQTIRLRRRDRGNAEEFSGTINARGLDESGVDLTLEKHFDASFEITSKELTLDLDSFSEQVLAPQIVSIAELVDQYVTGKYLHLPHFANLNASGVPSAFPTTIGGVAQLRKVNNDSKVPTRGRVAVWSSTAEANLLGIEAFTQANTRGDGGFALENAALGHILGYDHFMDQNVDESVLTAGTLTTAAVAADTAQGATSVAVDGAAQASGTLLEGQSVDIAGEKYTVAADVTMSTNAGTITLVEPLRKPVEDGDAVTVVQAASDTFQRRGAMFHPRAFAFASVPLAIPPEAHGAMISHNGLSIRVVRDYAISTKKSIISLDCLVGCKMVDGNLGAQVVEA